MDGATLRSIDSGQTAVHVWLAGSSIRLHCYLDLGPTVVPQHNTDPATRLRSRSDSVPSSVSDLSVSDVSRRDGESRHLQSGWQRRVLGGTGRGVGQVRAISGNCKGYDLDGSKTDSWEEG